MRIPIEFRYEIKPGKPEWIKTDVPGGWGDLTPKEYAAVLTIIQQYPLVDECILMLLKFFIKVDPLKFMLISPDLLMHQLWPLLKFTLEPPLHTESFVPNLKSDSDVVFNGPANGLEGITVQQMLFAQARYKVFTNTRKPDDLYDLLATLYTNKPYNNTTEQFEESRRFIKGLNIDVLMVAFQSFSGMLGTLPGRFPETFKENGSGADFNPLKMVMGVTGEQPWRKTEVESMDYIACLTWIENKLEEAEKIK